MFAAAVSTAARNCGRRAPRGQRCSSPGGHAYALAFEAVELARVFQSARSPRLRTASRIGRTTASASVNRAALRASRRPDLFAIFEYADHSHDLVQRIFDDALAARLLQPRE